MTQSSTSDNVQERLLKEYTELQELIKYISTAKREIISIRPKDISTDHIPMATDELDAVVGATEEATNKIMDMCDQITVIAGSCTPDVNEKLTECITRIFEACNFQDITGQRITKVVATLKYIDQKIAAIATALGEDMGASIHTFDKHKIENTEGALLNGPQLPQAAPSQDDIDKLMSEN